MFGVRSIRSKAKWMPSDFPASTTLASSSSDRSQLPNFLVRYSRLLIPSFGIVGLSWKGSQRTSDLVLAVEAAMAFSSRRLPM